MTSSTVELLIDDAHKYSWCTCFIGSIYLIEIFDSLPSNITQLFGIWFQILLHGGMQKGLTGAHKRANAIRRSKPVSVSSGAEGVSSLEEETTTEATVEDSEDVSPEIFMQKNFSSGHLLPSEVMSVYFLIAGQVFPFLIFRYFLIIG